MERRVRRADRATGIACRGLDPDLVEHARAQQSPIGDARERDAAGHAEALVAGDLPRVLGRSQHRDLFADLLDRLGEIHVALRDALVGRACAGPPKSAGEAIVRHGLAVEIAEVVEIEPQRAVVFQIDELLVKMSFVYLPSP